jgi:glycolate oxidase
VPTGRLPEALRRTGEICDSFGLRVANVFHAGDGNLHPLILFDDSDADSVARAEAFGAEILEKTVQLGGTISGEHGIGVEKLDQMCTQFDRATLDAFTGIKRAFDPTGLLNPGKVVPTLHRCGEFGGRRGGVPSAQFADLPRF